MSLHYVDFLSKKCYNQKNNVRFGITKNEVKMKEKQFLSNLLLPTEKTKKAVEAVKYFLPSVVGFAAAGFLYDVFGIAAAIIGGIAAAFVFVFFKLYKIMEENSAGGLVLSFAVSVYVGVGCAGKTIGIFGAVCLSLLMFLILGVLFGAVLDMFSDKKINARKMGRLLLSAGALVFTVLVYLPCDTYINNSSDFNFPIGLFALNFVLKAILYLIPAAYFGLVLKEKAVSVLCTLLCGLTLCVYAQYMFMNRNLGLMMGESVDWGEYRVFGIITLIVWIVLLILPFVLRKVISGLWSKLSALIPAFLGGVQLLTLIIMLISSDGGIYSYKNEVLDGSRQYTVSSKKNIVTFVFDAVDNYYFEQLLASSPEVFDGFEDFTLYNNTCSVHDYTMASMTQMLTGETSCPMYDTAGWLETAWNGEMAEDFYQRLHSAGYTVNAYMNSDVPIKLLSGKFDNCSDGVEPSFVKKDEILANLTKLNRYRYMPFLLKPFFDTNEVDFKSFVGYNEGFDYYNDDYYDVLTNMGLGKSDDNDNYFIIEHLNGAHQPCDDVIEETKKCLAIAKEYIKQLKAFGLYDDSTVIITSDHGRHTSSFAAAAPTPVFMVKEAGKSSVEMKISTAPVYHTDFLATYLKAAGIYGDGDNELYGDSVFDLSDDMLRERTWYDHTGDDAYPNPNGAACNIYRAYSYTGNQENLREITSAGTPTEVIVKE